MLRRIICFGDSNTWGFDARTKKRFPEGVRWTSLLARYLGNDFQVVEEGLSGRTSCVDDPLFEGLNGLTYIHPCLMSHIPFELVIIMLGTNDTKERFNLTPYNIAQGITRLAVKAKGIAEENCGPHAKVLVVAPPPIGKDYINAEFGESMGEGCDKKSEEFPKYLKNLLKEYQIEFLDTSGIVSMNTIDYMHLDEEGHKKMADLVYKKVKEILNMN